MKRAFIFLAVVFALISCKKSEPQNVEQYVNVTITYTLDTSVGGDMTKATNAEVFDMFYEKMRSGELVAPNYELTLTETTTGAKYVFSGKWANNDMVTIRTGKYQVEGKSTAKGNNTQELASIRFNEEIEISTSSSSVVLQAIYDCYLLAFAKSDITELKNYAAGMGSMLEPVDFFVYQGYYYVFVNETIYAGVNDGLIYGRRTNGSTFKIYTYNAKFDKGKYYIYNDVSGSFELPKMEAGI